MRAWQTLIRNKYEFFLTIENIRNKGYADRYDLYKLQDLSCFFRRRLILTQKFNFDGTLDLKYFEEELKIWKNYLDEQIPKKLKIIAQEKLKRRITIKRFKIEFYRAIKAGIIYQLIIKIKNNYDRYNK